MIPTILFAIVGKQHEPLYLREFVSSSFSSSDNTNGNTTHEQQTFTLDKEQEENHSLGGFFDMTHKQPYEACSIRNQIILHASLDYFDDPISHTRSHKSTELQASSTMWIGKLCTFEDTKVYGYITHTNVKFILAIENNDGEDYDEDGMEKVQSVRNNLIKEIFIKTHDLYVNYTFNPFISSSTPPTQHNILPFPNNATIQSKKFDKGIHQLIQPFCEGLI